MTTPYTPSPVHHATFTSLLDSDVPSHSLFNAPITEFADELAYLGTKAVSAAPLNWHTPVLADSAAAALDMSSTYARPDGSTGLYWAPILGAWILLSRSGAGRFYFGDAGVLENFSTAAAFRYRSGCETVDGRQLLVSADTGGANAFKVSRSDVTSLSTWTTITLPSTVLLGNEAVNDIVVFANGDLAAVGGYDGNYKCWTSTNHGASFTLRAVGGGVALTAALTRAAIGKSEILLTWEYTTEANGGSKVFYSTDHGVTWSSRTFAGHEKIRAICYLPAAGGKTLIVTEGSIGIVASDITADTVTWNSSGGLRSWPRRRTASNSSTRSRAPTDAIGHTSRRTDSDPCGSCTGISATSRRTPRALTGNSLSPASYRRPASAPA